MFGAIVHMRQNYRSSVSSLYILNEIRDDGTGNFANAAELPEQLLFSSTAFFVLSTVLLNSYLYSTLNV